eukprot:jgi/Undpi1/12514/HiC_scaffold_6.g02183.m1
MTSCGLDILSKLSECTSLDALREDFPRKSDDGLNPAEFLAVVQRHIAPKEPDKATTNATKSGGASGGQGGLNDTAIKAGEVFKQMDVRGDGEVCWDDFSAVDRLEYLPAPIEKLGLIGKHNEVVHLLGHGALEDDDKAPFTVESGGGSDLARITSSLRHDTAYKPHEVNAVHSIPDEDVVITSSSLGPSGPHVLTVWDLPTEEERSSEKQFLPALTYREETPTRQTVIFWAPSLEMVLTGCSENGSLLGWDLHPLKQSAKLWLHDAGITHIHELVGRTGGAPHVITASLDGTIVVSGGTTRGSRTAPMGDGVLQHLQAHERGVAHMAFCLHYSLALSVGVFVNAVETTSDVLAWKLDRDGGMLESGIHTRLKGHDGQVIGLAFIEEEREVVTGGADSTFLVWHVPTLVLKQRLTRSSSSPLGDQSISTFSMVPKLGNRPHLLVAGMSETGGLEIFARVKRTVHEALLKAEFCPYLQRFVTVSARRATVWDGKTGEAINTLTSKRLLGNEEVDITAFSLDHQGHKLVVGADSGEIRACLSHCGSLIRRLDPHHGPVNWLSFASRKSDKCIFSVGGDGALHVLDDADAIGYVKPSATRHHTLKKSFLPQTTTRPAGWGGGDPIRPCSRASSAIAPSTAAERRRTSASIRGCESNKPGAIPDKANTRYTGGRRAVTDAGCGASDEEENARKGDGRRGVNEPTRHQAKHHDDGRYEDVEQAELSRANGGAGGGGGGDGGGRSVLLRQIVFASSSNSDVDEEGNQSAQGVKHAKQFPPKAQGLVGAPSGVSNIDMHTATDSSFGCKGITPTNVLNSDHPEARAKRGEVLKTPTYAAKPEGNVSFYQVNLVSRITGEGGGRSFEGRGDLVLIKSERYDITGYAADDHLNLISTATTSDSGAAETGAPPEPQNDQGQPSSSVHLWDAERMTLVGTLLFPNPALTRDLATSTKEASLACNHRLQEAPDTAGIPTSDATTENQQIISAPTDKRGKPSPETVVDSSGDAEPPTPTPAGTNTQSPVAVDATSTSAKKTSDSTASDPGTDIINSRAALVTALAFLSPYPLLAGASTRGMVALWRVPDGVCVEVGRAVLVFQDRLSLSIPLQAIVLSADGPLPKRRRRIDALPPETLGADEELFTCMARGTYTPSQAEEVTVLYVGNGRGDILAAHLSFQQLVELSGNGKGPVACQRRVNHNPNRAVRVRITPRTATNSFQEACRAQTAQGRGEGILAADDGGVNSWACTQGPRDIEKDRPASSAERYNFTVPSKGFKLAWAAHSAAVSSVWWIASPPSLLSASSDGLAKIWAPDGGTLLGQLDINNKRPELPLSMKGPQTWSFVPTTSFDQQQNGFDPSSDTDNSHRTAARTPARRSTNRRGGATRTRDEGGSTTNENEALSDVGDDFDSEVDVAKASTRGAEARRRSKGGEKGRLRRQRQQQGGEEQEEEKEEGGALGAEENDWSCNSPDSMRFPTSASSRAAASHPTRASTAPTDSNDRTAEGGLRARSSAGGGSRSRPNTPKAVGWIDAGVQGGRAEPAWMTGWDGMTRQLKAFEEKLEASSSGRKTKNENANTGGSLSRSANKGGRKVPLHGKRWRTMSAPSTCEANGRGRDFSDDNLYAGREAGSIRIGIRKGMKGYVVPRPGTAEDAALKRLAMKGATGVVAKDKATGRSRSRAPSGRSVDDRLARPPNHIFPGCNSGSTA